MISYKYILEISYLGLIFFTALLLSLIFTPLSTRLAGYLGILDLPDPRKVHSSPIPRTGGLAMAASLFFSIFMCLKLTPEIKGFLSGAAVVVFLGMLDDKFSLPPKMKFLGEILAVVVFMNVSQISLQSLGDILGLGEIRLFFLGHLVTIFCMVGVMNALNLSDGLDGLAAGISVIACFFLFVFAYGHQDFLFASIIVILLGAVLGFLRYNTHPARLFMGDTGSLLLGYSLSAAAVAIVRQRAGIQNVYPVSMAIVLALPIVDTVWVMLRRLIKGQKMFSPDKTHLHHRLMNLGLSHAGVVVVIYFLMSVFGFLAWAIRKWPEWTQFYLALMIIVFIYALVALVEGQKIKIPARIRYQFKSGKIREHLIAWSGKSVRIVTPIFIAALLVPFLFLPAPARIYGLFALGMAFLLAVFFPWQGGKQQMTIAHALLYLACFSSLLIYHFAYQTRWLTWYFLILSLFAFLWVVVRVLFKRRAQVLLPSSFEILLIIFSWFIPFVCCSAFNLSLDTKHRIVLVCLQSIPLLGGIKVMLRRHARRNRWLALSFLVSFLVIGGRSFF